MTIPRWMTILAVAGLVSAVAIAPPRPPAVNRAERAPVTAAHYLTRARLAAARDLSARSPISRLELSGVRGVRRTRGGRQARGVRRARGGRWTGGGAVLRTAGRVFFTLDGTDYSCSGSTVASANADVVMTAAHCVSDGRGHWASRWIFVPGYRDGRAPYGRYPARAYFAAPAWQHGADEDDDVAFVAVGTARVDGVRQHVADAVGGQRIRFGSRAAAETLFGYPSEPPYQGRYLDYCAGPLSPDPYGSADAGIDCTMTEGGSGGPWFSGFDPRTGLGVITGVTTFRYSGASRTLYSADLGSVARTLYDEAQHA